MSKKFFKKSYLGLTVMSSVPAVATSKYHCFYASKSETVNETIKIFNENSTNLIDKIIPTIFSSITNRKLFLDNKEKDVNTVKKEGNAEKISEAEKELHTFKLLAYSQIIKAFSTDFFKVGGESRQVDAQHQMKKYTELNKDNKEISAVLIKHISIIFKNIIDAVLISDNPKHKIIKNSIIEITEYGLDEIAVLKEREERILTLCHVIATTVFLKFLLIYTKSPIHSEK